jgi:hypothetical protein
MRRFLLAGAFAALAYLLGAFAIPHAHGRDNGQYAQVSPDIRDWVKSRRNKSGTPCCDSADGYDAEWDNEGPGGSYRVRIDGDWIVIPEEKVLDDIPNRLKVARVWYAKFDGGVHIFCFIPGTMG